MRNKHLSRRKIATLIRCFCEDITALSTAALVGENRNTVNSYDRLIREAIFRQSWNEYSLYRGICAGCVVF
jgi:hypothetical protein